MLRSVHQPYFKAETFQDAKWLLFFSMIIHAKLITCKVSFVTDPSLTWTCVITRKIVWCRTEVHPFEQKNQRMEEAFKQFAKWSENISGWILSRNRIFLLPFFFPHYLLISVSVFMFLWSDLLEAFYSFSKLNAYFAFSHFLTQEL